jgi:hypothetical protein
MVDNKEVIVITIFLGHPSSYPNAADHGFIASMQQQQEASKDQARQRSSYVPHYSQCWHVAFLHVFIQVSR